MKKRYIATAIAVVVAILFFVPKIGKTIRSKSSSRINHDKVYSI